MHTHKDHHLILYLTEGAPLILPELKMTIQPKRGSYYIFPPNILHGVGKVETDGKTRYCLVTNIIEGLDWKKNKLIKETSDAREKK
jgi:quercetin dioxygenase-like cupin family protein